MLIDVAAAATTPTKGFCAPHFLIWCIHSRNIVCGQTEANSSCTKHDYRMQRLIASIIHLHIPEYLSYFPEKYWVGKVVSGEANRTTPRLHVDHNIKKKMIINDSNRSGNDDIAATHPCLPPLFLSTAHKKYADFFAGCLLPATKFARL